jgi:hypothetical protein
MVLHSYQEFALFENCLSPHISKTTDLLYNILTHKDSSEVGLGKDDNMLML